MTRVFAGPLCRYFAALHGGDAGEDAAAYVAGVERWRRDLGEALGERLRRPLVWDEDPAGEAVWFDLGESGLMALRLLAFYADRSELELPDTVPPVLELDREYRAAMDQKFERSRYGQLLAARCWLPGDFPFTARVPLPDGEHAEVGSLEVLRDQLRWLNERTFQADAEVMTGWRELPAAPGSPLLTAAQRGYAALGAGVAAALRHGQPLIAAD
ncbi:MAG: hypothetical protein AB7O97_08795 [Planctomycetota bacterium]